MDGSNYDYQLLLQSAFIVLILNLIIYAFKLIM